jgi:hypothetical protein
MNSITSITTSEELNGKVPGGFLYVKVFLGI